MLHLRGADAVRERAEGAVGRGVAVAADDRHARQREALLRPDDVDDALPVVELVVIFDAEVPGVLSQRLHLQRGFGIRDAAPSVGGRHVVIDHGQRLLRRMHRAVGEPEALEGLRAGHLMNQVAVDIEERGAVRRFLHQMVVPDLVIERLCGGHDCGSCCKGIQAAPEGASSAGASPAGSGRRKAVDGDMPGQEPPWHALAVGDGGKIEAAAQPPAARAVLSSPVKNRGFHRV